MHTLKVELAHFHIRRRVKIGRRRVTHRHVDHLLKRHDVPGRANHDDNGDLLDSAMPAEKNLVPSTAEVEQATEVTKGPSPEAGIPPLDLRSELRSSST